MNLDEQAGAPVLVAYNGGDVGRRLEQRSDDELTAEAMAVLRTIYG